MRSGATLPTEPSRLRSAASDRVAATNSAAERFFTENADAVAKACQAMANRFQRGGRLLVCGDGAQRSDVSHVVVEFLHPVVVGKRALPALAFPAVAEGRAQQALEIHGRENDLLMIMTAAPLSVAARALLATARAKNIQSVALVGMDETSRQFADFLFTVPSPDQCIVQETHEMLYHVLWELVHVFLDHRGRGGAL